ncbi:MAG: hypothetical protein ACK4M6_02025 [Hyphomonas sp.]
MKRFFASALATSAIALALVGPAHSQKSTTDASGSKPEKYQTPFSDKEADNAGNAGNAGIVLRPGNDLDAHPAGPISRPDPRKTDTRALPQTGDMDGDWRFSDKKAGSAGNAGNAGIVLSPGNAGKADPAGPISRPDPRKTDTRALPQTGDMDGDWRFSDKEAASAGNAGNAGIVLNPDNAGNAYPAGPISRHDPRKAETKTLPGHMSD